MNNVDHAHTLAVETAQARHILSALADTIGDDDELRSDVIAGETMLFEAIDKAVSRIAELDAYSEAIKAQIAMLTARRERFQTGAERLRGTIKSAMDAVGQRKLELAAATLAIKQRPRAVIITDERLLPDELLRQRPPEPDKKAIGDILKAGKVVPGAMLSEAGQSLQIGFK